RPIYYDFEYNEMLTIKVCKRLRSEDTSEYYISESMYGCYFNRPT
ncbi:36746_t:CDS:1, partial [Racocetra persica]